MRSMKNANIIVIVTVMMVMMFQISPFATAADKSERGVAFSYDHYAAVLTTYVNEAALVDYAALKANRADLDTFVSLMNRVKKADYETWSDTEKIAFWINAYNSLTLVAIIDHYPIKSSLIASFRFPKNSIRQISGVWTDLSFTVMGEDITLDAIEHKVLRAKFKEPRIHMALVCASIGCPPLRREPFTAEKLNDQLDDQARRFLSEKRNVLIDTHAGTVKVSSIFDWFHDDFIHTYGTGSTINGFGEGESAVIAFIASFQDEPTKLFLLTGAYKLDYLDYDWALNDQKQ